MLAYQGELEDAGGAVALATGFRAARPVREGFVVEAESGGERVTLGCDLLVNAAGLFAGAVAAGIEGLAAPWARQVFYCKGNYFGLATRVPFSHLIYPVPERDGLGTHLTLDLAGRGRFGPDTEWISGIDYGLDARRGDGFYAAIRRYWPELPDGALAPDYTGIRPKLFPAGGPATDFLIEGPAAHGIPGLVNLFGIESPGLTASLAIAEEVLALRRRADRRLTARPSGARRGRLRRPSASGRRACPARRGACRRGGRREAQRRRRSAPRPWGCRA